MAPQYTGWAYVSGSESSDDNADGPLGAVQYHKGGGAITGSARLMFLTASSNELRLTGSLLVQGNIVATNLDIVNHTVSYLSSSGASKFGDSNSDLHEFTGSISVQNIGYNIPYFTVTSSIPVGPKILPRVGINTGGPGSAPPKAAFTLSGSYAVNFRSVSSDWVVDDMDYFVTVTTAGTTSVTLPAAAVAGTGRLVIVKAAVAAPDLTVSASVGQTIDGDAWQKLYSDYASETYICDGVSAWHIV